MKFLLDENVHQGLFNFLNQLGHDVKSSPKGAQNGAVFSLAISEQRILITHDWDFTDWELYSPTHSGIILVRIPSRQFNLLKQSISRLLAEKTSPTEFTAKLILLWEDKFEER